MPSRSVSYARQCLAASGIAILDPRIAIELRGDMWASLQDCAITFSRKQVLEGTQRLVATVDGYGPVLIAARSLDNLAQRLEWIIGREVSDLRPAPVESAAPPAPGLLRQEQAAKEAERLARVRKLAGESLPGHDCELRREILAARRELGLAEAA
jgi:hypothetical protein